MPKGKKNKNILPSNGGEMSSLLALIGWMGIITALLFQWLFILAFACFLTSLIMGIRSYGKYKDNYSKTGIILSAIGLFVLIFIVLPMSQMISSCKNGACA